LPVLAFVATKVDSPFPLADRKKVGFLAWSVLAMSQAIRGIPWTLQDNPGTASIKGHLNLPPPQEVSLDAAIEEWCVMGRKIAYAVVLAAALISTLCGRALKGRALFANPVDSLRVRVQDSAHLHSAGSR